MICRFCRGDIIGRGFNFGRCCCCYLPIVFSQFEWSLSSPLPPSSNWIFISFLALPLPPSPTAYPFNLPDFRERTPLHGPPNELRRAFVSARMTSRIVRFNIANVCSPCIKQKVYTRAKVARRGKAAACSTKAFGISVRFFFFFAFFFISTECIVRFSTSPSGCHPT